MATAPQGGFTGAEFSIQVTNPEGYILLYVPPEGAIVFGDPLDRTPNDPLDGSGVNIAWSTCRTSARVAMGSIIVFNQSGGPTELQIKRRNRPPNPYIGWCPLFVACNAPSFDLMCMRACDIDATGGAIAARLGLNQAVCAPDPCATECAGVPCVTAVASHTTPVCTEQPITVTATATNCGTTPADLDVFIEFELVGSFAAVPPNASVVASRTYIQPGCSSGLHNRPAVGVLARNAECSEPFGVEIGDRVFCSNQCETNSPPDCSQAAPSLSMLWPPDGTFRNVSVGGITDPDGDPVTVSVDLVFSDESAGTSSDPRCPDALLEGPNNVRLRAERDPSGDGRVYRMVARAEDSFGDDCFVNVDVCVPRKSDAACGLPVRFRALATVCGAPGTNPESGTPSTPSLTLRPAGQAELAIPLHEPSDVRIEVFDVRGRLIRVLANAVFAPGEHLVRWDGTDDHGRAVASGVYAIRIRRGAEVSSLKAVIAR